MRLDRSRFGLGFCSLFKRKQATKEEKSVKEIITNECIDNLISIHGEKLAVYRVLPMNEHVFRYYFVLEETINWRESDLTMSKILCFTRINIKNLYNLILIADKSNLDTEYFKIKNKINNQMQEPLTLTEAVNLRTKLEEFIKLKNSPSLFTDLKQSEAINNYLKMAGYELSEVIPFSEPVTDRQHWSNLFEALVFCHDIMVGGFEPVYTNTSQKKWFPVPQMQSDGSGFALLYSYYDCTFTDSLVGPRLSFPSEKMSNEFFNMFQKEINVLLTKIPTKWQRKK